MTAAGDAVGALAASETAPAPATAVARSPTPGVFLIHGLGGTQYDLGSMHKRLKNAGFVTHSLTLPGHGTKPEDLVTCTAEDWIAAVTAKYHEVAAQHEVLHLMGMCMGSLLATELAKRERHRQGRLVVLAPPIYLDGWSTPWYRDLRHALYYLPGIQASMKVEEEDPFGIKNEQLRAIVKAKFERGENFHYRWVPLACVRQVDRLRRWVMTGLKKIECDTLVVHAREDELTSLRSANFLVEHIGGAKARMVILENSYHMVCVDNDRELVAKNVLEFFGATSAASLGMSVEDPRMPMEAQVALAAAIGARLEAGDLAGVFDEAIPDFAWFQPGASRASGVFRGSKGRARLGRWADGARFGAFGAPVFNAGMCVLPATLGTAAGLASPGVLAFALRDGKLLELRWFPDEVAIEDAHFGGAPEPDGPSQEEQAFEAASRDVKTLSSPPDNDALLALYALYKQGTVGDVSGARPSVMDMVGRSKYDAWAKRKGQPREAAMAEYVALVGKLKAGVPA